MSNYFSLLTDGSTDSAVIEEEVVYLLFLNEGKPEIKFFSIETPLHTTAEWLKKAISSVFKRTGMIEFHTNLAGFNVDGALVNRYSQRLSSASPWIITMFKCCTLLQSSLRVGNQRHT